ncbi:MAG: YdcF family protein [Rhodocyclales bacterium]|nr:YdcF family protein [Rhodocyclales bacterium]
MFYLKKLLSALVLPPFGLLLWAWFGLWLARRHPRSGHALVACALLILTALSLPPVATALMRSLEQSPPIPERSLARAQAIVILGGGNYVGAPEYGGDTVSHASLERVRYGADLQRRSGLPILVTGGTPYGGRPEGETMKEVIEREFKGSVRWAETASRDTAENAAFSAPLLKADGITRIALVSHGWHLPRATELFEREGMEVLAAPTGFTTTTHALFARALPSAGALEKSSQALREWLGIFVQRMIR